MKRLLALLALWPALAVAQPVGVALMRVNVAPTGLCQKGDVPQWVVTTGDIWACRNIVGTQGTWTVTAAAGSGTVNAGTTGQLAYYAADGSAVSGNPVTTDATGNIATPGGVSVTALKIDCAKYSTIDACVAAGNAYATTNESGAGKSAVLLLHDQTYVIASPPLVFGSGVNIIGVPPRLTYAGITAPDFVMAPNGGTLIDCGGVTNTCITGSHLRGNVFKSLGFKNFGTAMSFGGDGIDGFSFGRIEDIFGYGVSHSVAPFSVYGIQIYNLEHVRIDHIQFGNVNTCLDIVGQSKDWGGGNSQISDVYCSTTARTAATVGAGIQFRVLQPTVGTATSLDELKCDRCQVNGGSSDSSDTLIAVTGLSAAALVSNVEFDDVDLEGDNGAGSAVGIALNYVHNSVFSTNVFARLTTGIVSTNSTGNIFTTTYPGSISIDNDANIFYGQWTQYVSGSSAIKGVYQSTGSKVVFNGDVLAGPALTVKTADQTANAPLTALGYTATGADVAIQNNFGTHYTGTNDWYVYQGASLFIRDATHSSFAMHFVPGATVTTVVDGNFQANGTFNTRSSVSFGASGSIFTAQYKGSGTLTYTSITAPGCQEQPLTITNAAAGDVCYASAGASDIGIGFWYGGCRISAANTAQIKVCAAATGTPSAVAWVGWATH